MTTLFGFFALFFWLVVAATIYSASGTTGEQLDPMLGYFALVAIVFTGLWLAARTRERRNADRAAGKSR